MLEELRKKYLAMSLYVYGGSRDSFRLGTGSRCVFLVESDGLTLTCVDARGEEYEIPLQEVKLESVRNAKAEYLTYSFDPDTGHLLVKVNDQWVDYGPWKKYEPKPKKARRRKETKEEVGMGIDDLGVE